MIFIDTSVLIAAINAKDSRHARAKDLLREVDSGRWGTALVPDFVLVEAASWLVRKRGAKHAQNFVRTLLGEGSVRLLPCSDHVPGALHIFLEQRGTRLSLTDAAIVGMARDLGYRTIATFDSDFRAFRELRIIDGPGTAA